ncbi:conserved hypothetical protein [Leishmania major strain Friedlin]|uniref:Coiled-coil domain-containing protein 6 n=1 Tax=Leishmania major TaxID=5664 RepID=Q4Q2W4_LEIMA|nr:conserved hypothetical protein [Leishmania major strain Friedlin]CAG9582108.1 hypothetical_protein_-_conserved [Leishmania major strain Friedlin]CAJ07949.1 conserved hypothetical protein [Leishmania major strain Friedlin]|eukprot:XP_001686334.1 conserved hypothetical protein [Leishmania major strain Friedlin]
MSTMAASRSDTPAPVHEMSMERLRREYVSLKSTSYSLTVEESHLIRKIETLREESVRAVLNAEMKEEQVSNQLFRRLDGAEREVQRYQALLKEEESEAESLSGRIKEMRSQQTEVENALEERQEYLLMNLQRKLLDMARKKTAVEQELMAERQKYLDVLVTRLNMLRGRGVGSSTESSVTIHSQPSPAEANTVPVAKHLDVPLPTTAAPHISTPLLRTGVPLGDNHGMLPAEKPLREDAHTDAGLPLPFVLSPAISAQKKPKDGVIVNASRGNTSSTSGRLSASTTPLSADLTPRSSHSSETHHAVVALERKLNQLLLEQAAAMQRTSATEKQCAVLTAKLHAVQEATFLDRARASKMKEELEKARARLSEVKARDRSGIPFSPLDDTSVMSGSNASFDNSSPLVLSSLSLRERTRELLSSVPQPNANERPC